jgi:hypothetical protein
MTSVGLRVGDRITVSAGRALSGHTYQPLTRSVTIEISSVRPGVGGDLDVTGFALTTRGAWRAGVPTRTVVLPAGSYTVPVRVGDTVRFPQTGETPVVTAIHLRPDGTAFADLLFASGATTSGHLLAGLEHLARPATAPPVRPCRRRHDADLPCRPCAEEMEPVTTGCDGPLCRQSAEHPVVFRPPSSVAQVRVLCSTHRDAFIARNPSAAVQAFPFAEGTHNYFVDGESRGAATNTTRPAGADRPRNATPSEWSTNPRSPSPNATLPAPSAARSPAIRIR